MACTVRRIRRCLRASQHPAVLHLDRMLVGAAHVRGDGLAAGQFDLPVVQRTGHPLAVHQALGQRPALVRAAVVEGEHLVVGGAEHGDVALRTGDDARAERGMSSRAQISSQFIR